MSAIARGAASTLAPGQALPREVALERHDVLRRYDPWLAGVALALLALGIVMVASASVSIAARETGQPLHYLWRHAVYAALGVAVAWGAVHVPSAAWERTGPWLLAFAALLLVLVLVPGVGREVNGSARWLALGPLSLQPSEPAKLFVVLYLAGYLVRRSEQVQSRLAGFIRPLALLGIIAVLLLLEPDYGATVVMFATALGMLFLGGVPFWSFAGWMLAVCAILASVVLAAPYRVERLMTFLDPWADPYGSGFQLTQALIAIGRGEWLGVGVGESVQKLFYLPEAHTDFLFAVLAEELGLVGAAAVIGAFAFLIWRAFAIARRAELAGAAFGAHAAHGVALLIGLQAFVNVGVNLGLLPTKGLTLPLMSYGGTSLIASCLAIGILLRIDHELRTGRWPGRERTAS